MMGAGDGRHGITVLCVVFGYVNTRVKITWYGAPTPPSTGAVSTERWILTNERLMSSHQYVYHQPMLPH